MGDHHLAVLAEQSLAARGDHDALLFEGRTWRAAELADRIRRVGAGLQRLGVRPGDRVVVLMANCPEVGITYTASWRAGAVVTPIVFLVTAAELRHVLADSGAVAVVTTGEFAAKVAEAAAGAPDLRSVVVLGAAPGLSVPDGVEVTAYEALEDGPPGEVVDVADDDLAALMYTGGTTGRAKGVMLSHRNLWSSGSASTAASYVTGVTRVLNALPMSHAFGLLVTVGAMHYPEPGFSVLMRWFDPVALVGLLREHGVQRTALVPAMAQSLLALPLEEAGLPALRYLNVGAAPLAVETVRQLEARLPGLEVLEGYGCTESGGIVSVNRPGRRKLGTVGPPAPGYEARVVDDAGGSVPAGQDGEIAVRGDGVMLGYWNAPETTATTLRDGWLRTGDIGRMDGDGFLSVVDRKKDLVIRNGFNVYPRDVEDVLVEHPAVAMAGVVGRPDPRVGEEVVAFVALRPGAAATPDEIRAFAQERLAAYKYPREVVVVDALPLTSVGKLDRKALRARVG